MIDHEYFIREADKFAKLLPFRSPPVMVGHPIIGKIGICIPGRGFRIQGLTSREFKALLKDEYRARHFIFNQKGIITTWDGVLDARANGRADDRMYVKLSQTTVANNWSCFYRSGGTPGAGSYTNIPGGAAHNQLSAGAMRLESPGATYKKYLLNFGVQHLTGTNIVLLADLLVACGNISANVSGNQTVNSVAQTRQYGSSLGDGVMMILEVTTALGGTASNFTVNSYTNSDGTSGRTTAAYSMPTGAATFRCLPTAGGIIIPLQEGDRGVRSVETVNFSAAMGGGVVALLLYRPLVLVPTLAVTTYVERNTPAMLSGITELVKDASNNIACLFPFVLTSGTSTGVQTYFLQSCSG